jgi:hypothetical protein
MTDLRAQIEQLPLICDFARRCSPDRTAPCDATCMRKRILALLADHAAPVVGETPREIEDTTRPSGADEPEQGRGSHPLTPIEKETR